MVEKRGIFSLTKYAIRSIDNKTDTLNDVWLFSQNNKIPYRYGEPAPTDIVILDPGPVSNPNNNVYNGFNRIGVGTDVIIVGAPYTNYEHLFESGTLVDYNDVGVIYAYDLNGKNIAYIPSVNNPFSYSQYTVYEDSQYGGSVSIGSTFIFVTSNPDEPTLTLDVIKKSNWETKQAGFPPSGPPGFHYDESRKWGHAVAYDEVSDVVVVSDPEWFDPYWEELAHTVGKLYIYSGVIQSSTTSWPRLENNVTIIEPSNSSGIGRLGWNVAAAGNVVLATHFSNDISTSGSRFFKFYTAANGTELAHNFIGGISNHQPFIFRDGLLIIGYPTFNADENKGLYETGRVLVYSWTAGSNYISFTLETTITASDGKALDKFGLSIALTNNNKLIVGAPGCDAEIENRYHQSDEGLGPLKGYGTEIVPKLGKGAGAIYIYNLDGTGEIKVNNPTGQTNAGWGVAVGANDDVIVVGESPEYYLTEEERRESSGIPYQKVNILDFNSILANESRQNPTWYGDLLSLRDIQKKIRGMDMDEIGDFFGHSIAAGSNKLVVGGYGHDNSNNTTQSGAAWICDFDGSNQLKKWGNREQYDYFGRSVAIGSNKIVIAALGENNSQSNSLFADGTVRVYDLNGNLEASIIHTGDNKDFGAQVAVGDNKIVVGAPGASEFNFMSPIGAVYVYNLDGTGETEIKHSDPISNDRFGHRVAVGNGKIVVGLQANLRAGNGIYIYDLDGTNEVKILKSDSGFGASLAIAENKIFTVGSGTGNGALYIYNLDGTGEIIVEGPGGSFGSSIAVGDGKIFVGAASYTPPGQEIFTLDPQTTGKVYVYTLDGVFLYSFSATRDNADQAAGDLAFGTSLAVSDGILFVGDPYEGGRGSIAGNIFSNGGYGGAVYSYNINDLTLYHSQKNAVV